MHRPVTVTALLILAVGYAVMPVAPSVVAPVELEIGPKWDKDVCLQSHASTCAPAAATTLLHLARVETSERAMVDACLTSRHGTEPLGLFRGLVTATTDHSIHPTVASTSPDAWTAGCQLPTVFQAYG